MTTSGTTTFNLDLADLCEESWVPVRGYEGYCDVSSLGRVRSVCRVVSGRWGPTKRAETILAIHPANGRYLKVTLCRDGRTAQKQVHTLVLEAFVGPSEPGFQCDHIDFDITNNAVPNLRWVSMQENQRRRRHIRLTPERVRNIKRDRAAGIRCSQLAVDYDISETHVYQVISGTRWGDVT